jgi:hypothetical protein
MHLTKGGDGSMSKRISISIPDELQEKMEKWKDSFNYSGICQDAIRQKIQRKEDFQRRLTGEPEEMEQIVERLKKEKAETEQNYFDDGKVQGLKWAKSSHYENIMVALKWDSLDTAMMAMSVHESEWDDFLETHVGSVAYGHPVKFMEDMPLQWKNGFLEGIREFWDEVKSRLQE